MRFILQDYLSGLKERQELDAILPDLLRAMGFQIVKLAFRGEVEHGVDLAAYKAARGEAILYLIQVKAGDIGPQMWDSGPNSVRATLNNLLDVRFEDLTQPRLRSAKKQAILVHNGTLRENVREQFNGYIENNFKPRMSFERWDLDQLAELLQEYLLSERILPNPYQRLLKRTLAFLDVSDYDLKDFKDLLTAILPSGKNLARQEYRRFFGFLRLILALIRQRCHELVVNNLSPALAAHEYALLVTWGWMFKNGLFTRPILEEYVHTYGQGLALLAEWVQKVSPALAIPEGLVFSGTSEKVEYPLRTFRVIGNVALLAISFGYASESEQTQVWFSEALSLLISTLQNNPARHRPLVDNHSIDIFLGIWALWLGGQVEFARSWLGDLFENVLIRKQVFSRLPELYNNLDAVIEYEATDDRPIAYVDSSSALIYMLFEICLLLDAGDLYEKYRPEFADISLQVWYPPEDVETMLYSREVTEGDTEVIDLLPASFKEFRLDVQARHTFDKTAYSPLQQGFPAILLLAHKHFRTPVFPFWWRQPIFHKPNQPDDTASR